MDALFRDQLFLAGTPGGASLGSFMATFPPNDQELRLTNVAGNDIAPTETGAVTLLLPFGSDPNTTVTVEATGFSGTVPITVALIPDIGPRALFEAEIVMGAGDPATVAVPVLMPVNTTVHVQAWTR